MSGHSIGVERTPEEFADGEIQDKSKGREACELLSHSPIIPTPLMEKHTR